MRRGLLVTVVLALGVAVLVSTPAGRRDTPAPDTPPGASGGPPTDTPYLVVLGIAQDAGYPHAGCNKACCAPAWDDHRLRRHPSCVAVVDPTTQERWLFDCTPGFPDQLHALDRVAPAPKQGISGILLTHAHVGHYTGLIHLGREAMGTRGVPVYSMPRMADLLSKQAPWRLFVEQGNVTLKPLADGKPARLNERVVVTPLQVPHRGELSETVGFRIEGPRRAALYLPDIDKWDQWDTRIEDVIRTVDVAYLDGTFYAEGEIPGRNMAEIPHPFIQESIARFAPLSAEERNKVRFLHLNHTNPALRENGDALGRIRRAGHHVARQGEYHPL